MTKIQFLQDSLPEYFQIPEFGQEMPSSVFHGFFGRRGGVSRNVYASLNCGRGSNDDPGHVEQNLENVSDFCSVEPSNLLTMHQVHSAECVIVEEPWALEDRPQVDAMVTNVPGLALGALTADCAPVLFYGTDGDGRSVIGAAHAGWGGAFGGVLEATVEKMSVLGVAPDKIRAAIGPCIGLNSYEVGAEFFDKFCEADADNSAFFIPSANEGHYMFNLASYCERRLRHAGVRNVFVKRLDTYFHEEDFYSYRRSTHRKEADYGRQISVIALPKT